MPKNSKSDQMREDMNNLDPGITTDANDGDTSRDVEIANAADVRNGLLSASQMSDGNIEGTDVQWPPGRVEQAGRSVNIADVPVSVIEKSAGIAAVNPDDTAGTPGIQDDEAGF
jgi:hypothetical protein